MNFAVHIVGHTIIQALKCSSYVNFCKRKGINVEVEVRGGGRMDGKELLGNDRRIGGKGRVRVRSG
jgi:hypothetical protein